MIHLHGINCYEYKGTFQKRFSGFFPLRGGVPPYLLWVFGQNDFPLRGGVPPNSVKEKIRYKTAIFGQKTPILAFFDPFFEENFRQFSVKEEGGVPPFPLRVFCQNDFPLRGRGGREVPP